MVGMQLYAALLMLVWSVGLANAQTFSQSATDVLANVVLPQPTDAWPMNVSWPIFRFDVDVRLSGTRFVPFTKADQEVLLQSFQKIYHPVIGPVDFVAYHEAYPDPAAPADIREKTPWVDLRYRMYYMLNKINVWEQGANVSTAVVQDPAVQAYGKWAALVGPSGTIWGPQGGISGVKLLYAGLIKIDKPDTYIAHPLSILLATMAVTLNQSSGGQVPMTAEQASAVSQPVEDAILEASIGTLVEITSYSATDEMGRHLEQIEVTMWACRENATVVSPDCEEQVLAAIMSEVLEAMETQQSWLAWGIESVELLGIAPRQPPAPPSTTVAKQQKNWVPWHLDRVDQRSLPLDGRFTANATGAGVNVYIISSGILGNHVEFGWMDGFPGSRVQGDWGFLGLDPLQDCTDANIWFGFGTMAASLCCGLRIGPAKDAHIHSVRFREKCSASSSQFISGGLPAAMDLVLSTYVRPAVVLIDAGFSVGRLSLDDLETKELLIDRLNRFQAADITVVTGAGTTSEPCSNIIASHPATVAVAPSDIYDQSTAFGARNSSCIQLWAPSGGYGTGVIGALSTGPGNYTRTINRSYGAAAIVAGVAAQYLQLNPQASSSQVQRALLQQLATNHRVSGLGAGVTSPTSLLFTNITQPYVATVQPTSTGHGSSLSTGGLVGIVVAIAAAGVALTAVAYLRYQKKRVVVSSKHMLTDAYRGWSIHADDIEICKRPNGSEWLLGEGKYGRLLLAMKGGVTEVAVKRLRHLDERQKELLIKELDMLKLVSRDSNIVQFLGACVEGDHWMLVMEYLSGGDLYSALHSDANRNLQWWSGGKNIMLNILRALVYLHAHRVIHRDMKSRSVLLGRDRAKLDAVSLAEVFDEEEPSIAASNLAWTAPEVLLGDRVTDKANIFSCGVVLWELVTLEAPLRGRMRAVEVPRECPQEVADAISNCMQRDPALRPNARELYDRLVTCLPLEDHQLSSFNPSKSAAGPPTPTSGSMASVEPPSPPSPALFERVPSLTPSLSSMSSAELGRACTSLAIISPDKIIFATDAKGQRVELGRGSFGVVYRVLLDGVSPMAAKMIELGASARAQADFLKEVCTLWRLRHRSVVSLSAVSITPEGYGILLMELLEMGNLHDKLNLRTKSGQRAFSWYNKGKSVLLDMASALHYLHSLNITHFDLKSGNVLLSADLSAKLSDTGLSRVMTHTHHSLGIEGAHGTFIYMAPELLWGSRCTEKADIYSFGILVWEVCTGCHPKKGQLTGLQVPKDCPQAVAELYQQCIDLDPAARPSAKELVERLSASIAAEKLQGGKSTDSSVARALLATSEGPLSSLSSACSEAAGEAAHAASQPPQIAAAPADNHVHLQSHGLVSPFEALRGK